MIQKIGKPGGKVDSPITRVVDSVLQAQADHEDKSIPVRASYVEIAQKRAGESNVLTGRAVTSDELKPEPASGSKEGGGKAS